MKKVLLLAGALMLTASAAMAQPGINLSWVDCYLGGGQVNQNDACTANFGANTLIVAMNPGGVINQINGAQGIIDVQTTLANLPDYWMLQTGGCRQGRLGSNPGIGLFNCPEAWSQVGGVSGGANFAPSAQPNRGRITWIAAVPGVVTFDNTIAPDWYLMRLDLLKGNTTTCAGCSAPACLVANEIRLTRPATDPRGDVFMTTPAVSQHVTFQGGTGINCPGATPTLNSTWGQVKSLYR